MSLLWGKVLEKSKKRPWRNLHVSINSDKIEIEAIETTENNIGDAEVCEYLIPRDINVETIIADKGYYSIALLEMLSSQGIMPVIPPPPHAVDHRCIGESFKTKKLESQKTEGMIISNIINLCNSFGRPSSLKV